MSKSKSAHASISRESGQKPGVNTVVEYIGQNFHLDFFLEQEIMIPPAQRALYMTHIIPQRKMKPAIANFLGTGLTGFIKAFNKEAPTSKPIHKPTPEQQVSDALCIFYLFFCFKSKWAFLECMWSNVFWTAFTLGVILWSWVSYSWLLTLKLQFLWAHFNAVIYIQNEEPMVIPSSEILMSSIFCCFHHGGLRLP